LSWALDAGVKLFLPVWFRQKGNAGQPVVPAFAHWLHDGFFRARYAAQARFAIIFDNYNSCCDGLSSANATADLLDNVVPFWLATYWARAEAYLVGGAPLVIIYDPDLFISALGGVAAAAQALDGARGLARAAGFSGIHFMGQWCYGNESAPHAGWAEAGFGSTLGYHWPTFTDLAGTVPGGRFPPAAQMGALEPECSERQDADALLPSLPTLSPGWNDLPWNPAPGNSNRLWRLDSPEYASAAAAAAALLAERRARGATGLHATHLAIDNLNEWAEGHFVGPHREHGFARLDAIRAALAPGAPPKQWLLPEDVGLGWDAYRSCFSGANSTPCEN
jgi:hypothetical protein